VRDLAVPILALVALAACRSGSTGHAAEPTGRVPECEVGVQAPAGFQALETFHEDYPDHVGVRLGFRDQQGRELHAFAGIPGEFGEGLAAAGEVELAPGRTGLLTGSERVWVVEWNEGGVCDPRAALGNGFGREGFLTVLEEAGIAAGSG
jgi:hypothetical protein